MQRFERNSTEHSWKAIGKPIAVVVGKHGMGWDMHLNDSSRVVVKHEGDGLTPMGIYAIGPIFGFAGKSHYKAHYFPLTDASVCVDDVKSIYYNQLIDATSVTKIDWNVGEKMRQIPQYKFGTVVQYNTTPKVPHAGSCIFMHIWKSPTSGTAGCIAMEEPNLKETLAWLESQKNPIIVIFTMPVYKNLKSKWTLPPVKDE
jgi:D-alanyl-D-alanine dipeptidase